MGKINSELRNAPGYRLFEVCIFSPAGYAIMRKVARDAREFRPVPRRGGREGGREIFSETARKLPVQLNRKQYENLFESFDYTKEATVDAGKAEEREGQKGRGGIPGQGQGGGRLLGTRGKQWASIRLAKRIAFLLSN